MSSLLLADAKLHLNITSDTHDLELQEFIDTAEAAIAKQCGPLASTATTRRVRGGPSLVLPVTPVIDLTSVTDVVSGVAETVADLLVTDAGIVERLHGGGFTGRYYDVVYNAGRAEVPDDLLMGVKELVRHLWETQRGTGRTGSPRSEAASNTIPGAAYLFPFRVEQLIESYVQPGLA